MNLYYNVVEECLCFILPRARLQESDILNKLEIKNSFADSLTKVKLLL